MRIAILGSSFEPYTEVSAHERAMNAAGKFGACATFIGSTREFNLQDGIHALTLEHYPGMTERYLKLIADEAMQRWPLLDLLILHRVGELHPGDPIVAVAVWSAHRGAAFDSCRYVMEELKSRAPFWKKETFENHASWVDKNTEAG